MAKMRNKAKKRSMTKPKAKQRNQKNLPKKVMIPTVKILDYIK